MCHSNHILTMRNSDCCYLHQNIAHVTRGGPHAMGCLGQATHQSIPACSALCRVQIDLPAADSLVVRTKEGTGLHACTKSDTSMLATYWCITQDTH